MPSQIRAKDFTNPTFQSTSALLTQNPEYYTIWNFRRLILQNYISAELSKDPSSLPPSDLQAAEAANHTPAQHEMLGRGCQEPGAMIPDPVALRVLFE